MSFDSLINRREYLSAHYLAAMLPKDLMKKDGLVARWTELERTGEHTPRKGLRNLKRDYFKQRPFFAEFAERGAAGEQRRLDDVEEWRESLHELHGDILRALGFAAEPRILRVERGDDAYEVAVAHAEPTLVAIECGWAADVDAALDSEQAGLLLSPVHLDGSEQIMTGEKLACWLFAADEPPRYVLILAGGVVILADRSVWGEGRCLAVSLDVALGRTMANPAEIDTLAALFGADSLLPPAEGGTERLAELVGESRKHAVGVSTELREGLRQSVEIIANEVLDRLRDQGVKPEQIMDQRAFAKELGRESLRFLYRILFLLYAEARPELGVLPADHEEYVKGYGLERLGDLIVRDLGGEEARTGFHLCESLELLFKLVNNGYRYYGSGPASASGGEGLRFEPLKADLFDPARTRLIGRHSLEDPRVETDDDVDRPGPYECRCHREPGTVTHLDMRLRNQALYKVLKLLMLAKGRRKERGGFISYAQLGINQLGAVYEGLMSYTGFIADEELYEVAENGDAKDGSWVVPASKIDDYDDSVIVKAIDENGVRTDEPLRYRPGAFVYRLAGRDRQTSASYYTPESLTKVTVQLALRERLDQNSERTTAREILNWTICEPALGSGAFLNEAINQVAEEYLKRATKEADVVLDPEQRAAELQRVKAYIALHNSYGVDLNETAVELAEVSLWLNVMHPGLQAPWFGLHLRRGDSLIGAGRRVYAPEMLKKAAWLKAAPTDHPFSAGEIPDGSIHHFLLPAYGWGVVAGEKEAKALAPNDAKRLGDWRTQIRKAPTGQKTTKRLQALARRAEYLWSLVIERLIISEREISRPIDVWRVSDLPHPIEIVDRDEILADLRSPGTPYWRLKTLMDTWCALWFWPLEKADLLDGTNAVYQRPEGKPVEPTPISTREPSWSPIVFEQDSLFGESPKQLALTGTLQAKPTKSAKRSVFEPFRSAIPLKDLEDWLDFAEALLGRVSVPDGSLITHFEILGELGRYEDELPNWTGMLSALLLEEHFPWLHTAQDIAEQQGFFHWELQFAQIFYRGGFDLQAGNPPWVQPTWNEASVLAELDPWFALSDEATMENRHSRRAETLEMGMLFFLDELARQSATGAYFTSRATYPLLVGTQPNLYRAFMIRSWSNMNALGVSALIHPDTHLGGDKEAHLRASSYRRLRIHAHFSNLRGIFPEIRVTRQFGINIYGNHAEGGVKFTHLSWLFDPTTLIESLAHDGAGNLPGMKHNGEWDIRPHRARIFLVDDALLGVWQTVADLPDCPLHETPILYPITVNEQEAISALASSHRLSRRTFQISSGYHEKGAKDAGLIAPGFSRPADWKEAILRGPHIHVSTPFAKQAPDMGRSGRFQNLIILPDQAIPATDYHRACERNRFTQAQDKWPDRTGYGERPYTDFYRAAWREMIAFDTERSLFVAIIPPGASHVHAMKSMALEDDLATALACGFWSALPLDYLLRITGRNHLGVAEARSMPTPDADHPLATPLLLRTLRLNCLTDAYGDIWRALFTDNFRSEQWAVDWPNVANLANIGPDWLGSTPLRDEQARRAALVEIDALVAVWLGIDIEALIAIYRSRYAVLNGYDNQTWFDARGRKLAADWNSFGWHQGKDDYPALLEHLRNPDAIDPPSGYEAPFYRADREAEYRKAHTVFAARMRSMNVGGQ